MRLRGIIPATVLPMDARFRIDLPSYRRYLRWLVAQGVHGLAVNVDTGEGPHLTHAERLRVLEAARREAGSLPLVAGLAGGATAHAVAAARDFKTAGADALLVFPPGAFRGRPLPPVAPVRYHRDIAEGAGLPLVLFQLQETLGGVAFDDAALLAMSALPGVAAIKEASFSRRRYRATLALLRRERPRLAVLTGNDNFIHDSLRRGAEGALIGFGTLAAAEQVAMFEALADGDRARAAGLGRRIQRLADVVFAPPVRDYRARLKEALRLTGVIPCAAVRPPLTPIPPDGRRRLAEALRGAGLL